ncbi:MAG: aspartate/glutamate racemase family protein [Candidatus Thorarchaeota archaeon]
MKRIGILGGMSYESTIKYYDLLLEKYYEKFHDYHYPEVLIFSLNFQKLIDLELGENREKYIDYLMSGIDALEKGGATFIAVAANSPHAVYNDLENKSGRPILSIVKATADIALKEGMKRLLLLGIKFTMQNTFYQEHCKKLGIDVITPSNEEQNVIDKIIFDELVIGVFKHESKEKMIQIINQYDIDGVILGCTELPLILTQMDTEIKLLDTLEIHVDAILDYYLSLG